MRAFLLSALVMGACNTPYLSWTAREPLAARRGRVAFGVDDRRSDRKLGVAYGWGGVPREIVVRDDEPVTRLTRLLGEALYTSGLAPSEVATTPTARAALVLDTLRCDGSGMIARASLDATFVVNSPAGEARITPLHYELRGKGRGCEDAFHDVLDKLLDEISAALVEGPAHDAAIGETVEG